MSCIRHWLGTESAPTRSAPRSARARAKRGELALVLASARPVRDIMYRNCFFPISHAAENGRRRQVSDLKMIYF